METLLTLYPLSRFSVNVLAAAFVVVFIRSYINLDDSPPPPPRSLARFLGSDRLTDRPSTIVTGTYEPNTYVFLGK